MCFYAGTIFILISTQFFLYLKLKIMADNNRNQSNQSYNQDWNREQQNQEWNKRKSGYGDQLKGGYSGSEYGNSYYRAGYEDQNENRVNYIPDHEERDYTSNRYNTGHGNEWRGRSGGQYDQTNYGNENRYGSNRYGNDYNPGGYGKVGNTGGSFYDTGNYGNRSDHDRNGDYGSSYNQRQRNYDAGNYRENMRGDRDWWDRTRDEVSSWFGDDDAERRRDMDRRYEGEHKGKGPRGYQRSSERIREDVCDRLSEDPFVDASDIDVKVEGTEVVLSGTVASKEAKRRAEDLVESISGVRNVENRIRVDREHRGVYSSDRNYGGHDYTQTTDELGNIGSESGTTNEIIRNSGKGNR